VTGVPATTTGRVCLTCLRIYNGTGGCPDCDSAGWATLAALLDDPAYLAHLRRIAEIASERASVLLDASREIRAKAKLDREREVARELLSGASR
jgi:hypothetical protein